MEARTFFKDKECYVSSFAGNVYIEKKMTKEERKSMEKDDPRRKSYQVINVNDFPAVAEALQVGN